MRRPEPLFEKALSIDEKVLGPDHADVANILENLARLLISEPIRRCGDIVSAGGTDSGEGGGAPTYRRCPCAERSGQLVRVDGAIRRGGAVGERAIAMQEKAEGPEHPDVANSLEALATLYLHEGKYAEAEPLVQRELRIREKALGPDM